MINWLEKNRHISILITSLFALTIFLCSCLPGTATAQCTQGSPSIIYHFSIFFLFSFFLLISIIGKRKIRIKYISISVVVSITYAILDELHQIFVPGRYSTIEDVLIDCAGILIATLIYLIIKKKSFASTN